MRSMLPVLSLALALWAIARPPVAVAQPQPLVQVGGPWVARNVRSTQGVPSTLNLDLTQQADSVLGQMQVEFADGSARPWQPVRGQVRGDSLLLVDLSGMPLLAGTVRDRMLLVRFVGASANGGRRPPGVSDLAETRPVRFVRP